MIGRGLTVIVSRRRGACVGAIVLSAFTGRAISGTTTGLGDGSATGAGAVVVGAGVVVVGGGAVVVGGVAGAGAAGCTCGGTALCAGVD